MILKRGLVLQHMEGEERGSETCRRTKKRGLVRRHGGEALFRGATQGQV